MALRRSRWVSTVLVTVTITAAATSLSACGSSDSDSTSSPAASESATTSAVVVEDPWVKAVDSGMTAAFMTLENDSDSEVTLVSATTPASQMVELHETVMEGGQMVMQPKEGGIAIEANDHAHLEPGGDHIMLMDVTEPIEPGDTVSLTLTFDDGSTLVVDALAKKFSGAEEDYDGGDH